MIPEGWRSSKIGKISEGITSGSRGWAAYYADSGSPFIRITNLRRTSIFPDYGPMKYVALPDSSNEGRRTELRQGDILVSITADLGVIGYIESRPETPSYISQHIARVRIKSGAADPRFIAYQLAAPRHAQIIERLNDAGAKAGLNLPTIASIPVLLPSLAEQRLIAETLHTWDRAIETVEALIANARAQKQALMQQLLPQGTTPPKKRLPGFSGEWREIRLGAAFSERLERGDDQLPLLSVTQANGVIPQSEAGRRNISSDDQSNYKTVRAGDIAYNTMRMWQGASALSTLTGKVSPAYTIVTPRKGHDALFYAYLFKQPKMIHVFERHSQGLVSDTWNLKYPHLAKIRTCVPDIEEQRAIAAAFASLGDFTRAY